MVVHTIFALIFANTIKNVCVGEYTSCNQIAHDLYGQEAFAVEVTQYPVQEGDKYIDGQFRRYTDEKTYTVIDAMPTDSQEVQELKGTTANNSSEITLNTSDITDIQVALAEIYETLGGNT